MFIVNGWEAHIYQSVQQQREQTHIDVDGLDGIDMDIGCGGRTVPLAKLVAVVLLVGPETGRDGYRLGRGHSGVAYRPGKMKLVCENESELTFQETFLLTLHIYYLCLNYLRVKKQWEENDSSCYTEECEGGGLTRWSRMGEVMDRHQTRGLFPLRRPPPGWTGDARRTWTLATSCRTHIITVTLSFSQSHHNSTDAELNQEMLDGRK